MWRSTVAAALLGAALALTLPALGLATGPPSRLIAVYWPLVLVTAGLGGLRRGLGPELYGRWIPLGCLVGGLTLVAAHLSHLPLGTLALAALLAWAGLAVAFGGRGKNPPGPPSPR